MGGVAPHSHGSQGFLPGFFQAALQWHQCSQEIPSSDHTVVRLVPLYGHTMVISDNTSSTTKAQVPMMPHCLAWLENRDILGGRQISTHLWAKNIPTSVQIGKVAFP